MIKKESTKPKGFKNTPHLEAPDRKTLPVEADDTDEENNSVSRALMLAFMSMVFFIVIFVLAVWPTNSTQVDLILDTTIPVVSLSKQIDREENTTSYTFTYGQEHKESMTISKEDDTIYLGNSINAKGNFETYYIESTTDKRFKSMKNALVNVDISKIQDDSKGSVRFHFNPGAQEDVHREIYLSIK